MFCKAVCRTVEITEWGVEGKCRGPNVDGAAHIGVVWKREGGGGGFRALLDKPGFIIGSAFFFLSLLDLDKPQSDQGHIPLSPLAL